MRIDVSPRHKNAGRPAWKVAEAFKQWERGRKCVCGGSNPGCFGPIQTAHVPFPGEKGIASKVADRHCLPLSVGCHKLQHDIGWPEYSRLYMKGRDPAALSDQYWNEWPGRAKWEQRNEGGVRR